MTDGSRAARRHDRDMHPEREGAHRQLCTLELIAEGHAERCPGAECVFWESGCALARIETALDGRPEVAQILLDLRRELEAGRAIEVDDARARLADVLREDDEIDSATA